MSLSEQATPTPETSRTRLPRLIYGRLLVATLILLATWVWGGTYVALGSNSLSRLLFTYGAVVLLTFVYELARRFVRGRRNQAKAQVWIDILLVSAIVWQTGGFSSPYVTLFIISTSVAGYVLTRAETILYAVSATFAFLLLALIANSDVLFSEDRIRVGAMQTIAFTTAGILFVGLLAARLADKQRVGEELLETVESLADMRILHERIVESISSGLITTDREGNIFAFNRAAEEISGLSAHEVIGKSIFEILGDSARIPFEFCIGSDGSNDSASPGFETSMASSVDGGTDARISVACTVSPLVGRNRHVTGAIITVQDVTALRAMEESLRRSDRLAAVGRMSAGLAHEIRNPLGSMSAALQFLKERPHADEEDKELLEVALREAERLEQIISNFLAYARPNNPVYSKDGLADTDVNQAIGDCVSLLEHSPERTVHHEIRCELPEEPVIIRANESQMKQVFWNLSRNAMQAMPDGGELIVRLRAGSEGSNVRITFEDTGRGIDREQLDRIFEPFSDGAKGTGLGLSIVHKIVTEHGGRIDIESEVGKGTKVTIELPQ